MSILLLPWLYLEVYSYDLGQAKAEPVSIAQGRSTANPNSVMCDRYIAASVQAGLEQIGG